MPSRKKKKKKKKKKKEEEEEEEEEEKEEEEKEKKKEEKEKNEEEKKEDEKDNNNKNIFSHSHSRTSCRNCFTCCFLGRSEVIRCRRLTAENWVSFPCNFMRRLVVLPQLALWQACV